MVDNLTPKDRKKNMSRIRSRGNRSTERRLRSSLVGAGVAGFKLHDPSLPGKPDFSFSYEKVAVFVDGCFWHGCPTCYVRPKSSQDYWDEKLTKNKARDIKADSKLREMGWTSVRIWEHTMKNPPQGRIAVAEALAEYKTSPIVDDISATDAESPDTRHPTPIRS